MYAEEICQVSDYISFAMLYTLHFVLNIKNYIVVGSILKGIIITKRFKSFKHLLQLENTSNIINKWERHEGYYFNIFYLQKGILWSVKIKKILKIKLYTNGQNSLFHNIMYSQTCIRQVTAHFRSLSLRQVTAHFRSLYLRQVTAHCIWLYQDCY